jgi:hypothetical protein
MASPISKPKLARLQEAWSPEWSVWRSRNSAGELNQWCATRRGRGIELGMTLMEPTADQLEAALREQGERGRVPLRVGYPA